MLEVQFSTAGAAGYQGRIVFGREARPWTVAEIDKLKKIARRACNRTMLGEMFPDRTLKATKKQLSKVREEMGCKQTYQKHTDGPAMLDPDDAGYRGSDEKTWRRRCERSNAMFIAAMNRAGLSYRQAT